MDITKVRELTDNELYSELTTQRRHLYDLRFQLATRQLDDHSQLTATRRSIARLLTVMTERDLDERAVVKAPQAAPRRRGRVPATTGKGGTK
jgi:large subunit ribosomal protein L29